MGICSGKEKEHKTQGKKPEPASTAPIDAPTVETKTTAPAAATPAVEAPKPWSGQLKLRTLTSDLILLEDVSSANTVAELKTKVAEKTGADGESATMRIVAAGVELLDDSRTLSSLSIDQKTLLVLLFRLTEREREELAAGHHGTV